MNYLLANGFYYEYTTKLHERDANADSAEDFPYNAFQEHNSQPRNTPEDFKQFEEDMAASSSQKKPIRPTGLIQQKLGLIRAFTVSIDSLLSLRFLACYSQCEASH